MKQQPILLVEDNKDDVELTLMAFEQARITNPVIVARDGVEALDYLFGEGRHAGRDARERPVVILLDLKLPRIGGLQVLERVRQDERTQYIPVVILTTSTEHEDMIAAGDLHANSYVRKPVDFDTFVDAARQLGLYWTVLNEPVPVTG
ncbi:MAG TPA: response regulator [Thermoanaerobaculia bacterium]|nr:response regulator [Thermoanaerobaculia bacterium]